MRQYTLEREAIVELENKLAEAIKSSSISFLENVLHDDLLFLAPDGSLVTKLMDLTAHKSGEMLVEKLIIKFEEIKIIGDCATVVVIYDTKGKMLGRPIEGQFRYIRFWQRSHTGLQVIGGSCFKL